MNPDEDGPKLHIDSDWKAEAQAEKERLAQETEEKAQAREAAGSGQKLPEANFTTLMSMLASQAIMGLGAVQGRVCDAWRPALPGSGLPRCSSPLPVPCSLVSSSCQRPFGDGSPDRTRTWLT